MDSSPIQNPKSENGSASPEQNQQSLASSAAKSLGLFIWDLIKIFVISFAIILPIRYYVAQPFIVQGSSMEPNFHNGEYLIIDELSYRGTNPNRGDIIVFKFPKDTKQYFIKRVIGLPGETVEIQDGKVEIFNKEHSKGFFLAEPYLSGPDITFGTNVRTTLGSDEFYVLGDNRTASSDSRFWGSVPRNDVVGRVLIRAYPFDAFTKFDHIQYNN